MAKKPKTSVRPQAKKRPAAAPRVAGKRVRIDFRSFDAAMSWNDDSQKPECFRTTCGKVREYCSRTWGEIEQDRKRDHAVEVSRLCKRAQERLVALKLDDLDVLHRFRFSGTERLWGLRIEHKFFALWWDPDHVVCPSRR